MSTRFGVPAALGGGVHTGLDFPVRTLTPVKAPARGVVRDVFYNAGGGRMVAITHSDTLETRYAHLTSATVRKGQLVEAGQLIAYSGASGALVKGAHLHFEVWTGGRAVDPAPFLGGVGNTTPAGAPRTVRSAPKNPDGSCPTGYIRRDDLDKLYGDQWAASIPVLGSIIGGAGYLIGSGRDDDCLSREDAAAVAFQQAASVPQAGDVVTALVGPLVPIAANVALLVAAALIGWGGVRRILDS